MDIRPATAIVLEIHGVCVLRLDVHIATRTHAFHFFYFSRPQFQFVPAFNFAAANRANVCVDIFADDVAATAVNGGVFRADIEFSLADDLSAAVVQFFAVARECQAFPANQVAVFVIDGGALQVMRCRIDAAALVVELWGVDMQGFAAVDVAAFVVETSGVQFQIFFGRQDALFVVDSTTCFNIQRQFALAGNVSLFVIQLRGVDDHFLIADDAAATVVHLWGADGDARFAGEDAAVFQFVRCHVRFACCGSTAVFQDVAAQEQFFFGMDVTAVVHAGGIYVGIARAADFAAVVEFGCVEGE